MVEKSGVGRCGEFVKRGSDAITTKEEKCAERFDGSRQYHCVEKAIESKLNQTMQSAYVATRELSRSQSRGRGMERQRNTAEWMFYVITVSRYQI